MKSATATPEILLYTRIRKSPFFYASRRHGITMYSVYNHTYHPRHYGDPVAEYWHLLNGVTLWDVGVEKQVEITGPDAFTFTNMLVPRDLNKCKVGQCKYVFITAEDGGIINDPVLLRLGDNHFWLSLADSDVLLWAKGLAYNSRLDVQIHEPLSRGSRSRSSGTSQWRSNSRLPRRRPRASIPPSSWRSAWPNGFHVVPHISARLVVDDAHLRSILQRMSKLGMQEMFVIAGDRREVAGKFADSLALLTAMTSMEHDLREIGISGYPESHPFIDDDITVQAMWDKRRFATYIVSNLCFDARVITAWISRVRRRGVELPIYVGMPGTTDPAKLFRVATKIGVGESARFLRWHSNWFLRMLLPGGHRPTRLIAGMLPDIADPAKGIAGLHIYTFNDIERTERWRRATLAELEASA